MQFNRSLLFGLFLLVLVPRSCLLGQSSPVKFDVPALIEVTPVINDCVLASDDPYEQLIEIVVPISCWVEPRHRDHMHEFRFDIYWHRSVFPVADYSPKTLLQSPVRGFIATEKHNGQTLKVGGNSAIPAGKVSLGANVESAVNSGTTTRFEEIPQHELLVAAGSINRGTGAFFRFHAAKQFSLEGGREISMIYRVPRQWRAGVIRVDCLAIGSIRKFPGVTEDLQSSLSFIVPAYMKGDHDAHEAALNYVQAEQSLRQTWSAYVSKLSEPTLMEQMQKAFKKSAETELPKNWVLHVIQSTVDLNPAEHSEQLPSSVKMAVQEFADSRKTLIGMAN